MNTKFQIQIKTRNWEGGSPVITKDISLDDMIKFANLIATINKNANKETWNMFGKGNVLPMTWYGDTWTPDEYLIRFHMKKNFGYEVTNMELVKEIFLRFTPHGCDGIEWIKLFKVEEIEVK